MDQSQLRVPNPMQMLMMQSMMQNLAQFQQMTQQVHQQQQQIQAPMQYHPVPIPAVPVPVAAPIVPETKNPYTAGYSHPAPVPQPRGFSVTNDNILPPAVSSAPQVEPNLTRSKPDGGWIDEPVRDEPKVEDHRWKAPHRDEQFDRGRFGQPDAKRPREDFERKFDRDARGDRRFSRGGHRFDNPSSFERPRVGANESRFRGSPRFQSPRFDGPPSRHDDNQINRNEPHGRFDRSRFDKPRHPGPDLPPRRDNHGNYRGGRTDRPRDNGPPRNFRPRFEHRPNNPRGSRPHFDPRGSHRGGVRSRVYFFR